jgi:hypothetical protein
VCGLLEHAARLNLTGSLSESSLHDHFEQPRTVDFVNEITARQLGKLFRCIWFVGFCVI